MQAHILIFYAPGNMRISHYELVYSHISRVLIIRYSYRIIPGFDSMSTRKLTLSETLISQILIFLTPWEYKNRRRFTLIPSESHISNPLRLFEYENMNFHIPIFTEFWGWIWKYENSYSQTLTFPRFWEYANIRRWVPIFTYSFKFPTRIL